MGISETLLWLIFVVETAMMEAAMFHQIVPHRNPKIDEHTLLTIMRITVYFCIFKTTLYGLLFAIPLALMFPFIHDGVYYTMRNEFDSRIYPLRWKDQSTTTDAKFSFYYKKRETMFLIGIVLWIFSLYIGLQCGK